MIQILALNVQKINISEKGTLLSTNTTERLKDQELMKEERGIKKWTRRRLIPSLTARLTTGHLGWCST